MLTSIVFAEGACAVGDEEDEEIAEENTTDIKSSNPNLRSGKQELPETSASGDLL